MRKTLTICLDSKLGQKRKEEKGKGRKEKEGGSKEAESTLFF